VNSNPATIMTDPELAHRTYIEPLTPELVAKVIAREQPQALLPTLGGQTGLNLAVALAEDGTLDRYSVELIGAKLPTIKKAEDRDLFKQAMQKIGRLPVERDVVDADPDIFVPVRDFSQFEPVKEAAEDGAGLELSGQQPIERVHAELHAGACAQQDEQCQQQDRDGGQQGFHNSGPTVKCTRRGGSSRLTPTAMSRRIMPTGDSQRRPAPTPTSSGSERSFSALPKSLKTAKPQLP